MRDYPQYYGYFSQQQFTFRGQTINNHNHLLGRMPGVDGLKTGFTNASGFNLAVSAVRDDRRLIAVVLGGSTTAGRDQNVEDLLLTGFDVDEPPRPRREDHRRPEPVRRRNRRGPVVRPPSRTGRRRPGRT